MSNKLRIALLAGGDSSEREIALNSAHQISEALDREKYDVKVIDLHHRSWAYTENGKRYEMDKNDFSLTVEGVRHEFDYALIIIHGTPGEDGKLQGYLDMMGIPYSSCSQVSSTITFDKVSTKRTVAQRGINVAKEIFLHKGEAFDADAIVAELGLPLFVKPNASGSSFGVTRVTEKEQIAKAVELAFTESEEVLIEECITGREFGCGVLITKSEKLVLPITEIVSKNAFFDYEAKYVAGMSNEITPAPISEEWAKMIAHDAVEAYKACRCRGIVRIDFIVTEEGKAYLIEVNSIPGMSSGSIVPKQARTAGISIGEIYDKVIADTMA